ncbi:MAG: efflux RND transporter periplasmic adaptor subunit [Candidatus Eisenbacteria bacterium]
MTATWTSARRPGKTGIRVSAVYLLLGIGIMSMLAGCGGSEGESKSMEQIHAEEGVPVRVEVVTLRPFIIEHAYNGVLTGELESSAKSEISGTVERIYFRVGDRVSEGEVVVTFPTDNPAAQYFQAKVSYENSAASLERMETLYQDGGISKQDLDNARTQYEVAKANWNVAEQAVKVEAPLGGIVTQLNVRESDNVEPEEILFTVSQARRLKARLWVPESQIADMAVGAGATATWGRTTLDGEVTQVDMSLNSKTQAFGVFVEFDNPDLLVMSGVNAEIKVLIPAGSDAVVVSRRSLMREDGGYFVYVAQGSVARTREVVPGRSQGLDVEIVSGLEPGDVLVTEGQMLLEDGAKLNIVEQK